MEKLLITLVTLGALALPGKTGVLLPSLFAAEFCSLRDRGLGYDESLRMAAKGSHVEGTPKRVPFHGVMVDEDVLLSYEAIKRVCPGHVR
jgi:hypothetical protein